MPDTETTVPPALTAREWAEIQALPPETREQFLTRDPATAASNIALNNFALPDGDSRKLTRAHVAMLREVERLVDSEWGLGAGDDLGAFADTLAALLPPE